MSDLTIGKLGFKVDEPPLAELFGSGLDLPEKVRDGIGSMACEEEMRGRFWLAQNASTSDTHSFAQESFIPYPSGVMGDSPWDIAEMFKAGQARLLHSRVVMIRDAEGDAVYDSAFEGVDLDEPSKSMVKFLKNRRGRVGDPLVALWEDMRHLDLLPADARKVSRRYGSGSSIPKFEVDGFLFHIENKPLRAQIDQMLQAECRGIVWSESYMGRENDDSDPFPTSPFGSWRPEKENEELWFRRSNARPYEVIDFLALEFRNPEAALMALRESMNSFRPLYQ